MGALIFVALLAVPTILAIGIQSIAWTAGGRGAARWTALLSAAACAYLLVDFYSTPWLERNDRLGFSAILVPGVWLALTESLALALESPARNAISRYLAWDGRRLQK